MDTSTPSPTPEARLHVLDYWRIIRIRKAIILAVFLIVVMTTTVVTFIIRPQYASTVTLEVNKDSSDTPVFGPSSYMSLGADPYFVQNEFQKIKSQKVLSAVIKALNLQRLFAKDLGVEGELRSGEALEVLRGHMELVQVRNTQMIEVTVFNEDASMAAQIANQIATAYSDYRQNQRSTNRVDLIQLEADLEKQNLEVQEAYNTVESIRKSNNITDIQALDRGATAIESEIVRRLVGEGIPKQSELASLESIYNEIKDLPLTKLRQVISSAAPEMAASQGLSVLLNDLALAEQTLDKVQKDYGPEAAERIKAEALVRTISNQIDERVEGMRNGLRTRVLGTKNALAEIDRQIKAAREKDQEITGGLHEYLKAKDQLDLKRNLRDHLAMRISQTKIERNQPKPNLVQITETAEPNLRPAKPNKVLYIAISVVIGLIAGIGLAFFIEYLDTSVKTIDDVERTLQAPVLGVIPQNVGLILDEGPEGPHAEAYRVLRTNLIFSRKDEKWNTLTIVSAGAGEGKSTTLMNLATIFAQNESRVLIVDSDLRRPSLHKLLKVSNSPGLTNVLLGQNKLEEVIIKTSVANLEFLPSGRLPSSSMGILNSTQMKDLIRSLKQRYDYVFFDSPPIMGVSDAAILASEVDMTMQVIQYRRYPQLMTIRAKQMIEKVGGHLQGLVLNNINVSQDENYYYYSGYHYDQYSRQESEEDEDDGRNGEGKASVKPARGDLKPKY